MSNFVLKIEKFLFYFLIFSLPFQARKIIHQWGDYFNEYQSAFIYLSDIFVVAVLLLWLLRWLTDKSKVKSQKSKVQVKSKKPEIILGLFLVWSFLTLFWAANFSLGLYQWVKLSEFALIFLYIKHNFKSFYFLSHVFKIFIASGLLQALIAIGQFFRQGSLGLQWLGESVVGLQISGTANFFLNDAKIIRAYGTFPHPNLLAAFLLISLFLLYYFFLRRAASFKIWSSWQRFKENLFLGAALFLVCSAIVLSFSRTGIFLVGVSTFLLYIFLFFKKTLRQKYLWEAINLAIILLTISLSLYLVLEPALASRAQVSLAEPAVDLRLVYNRMATDLIRDHPFGVGLGNYIWHLNSFGLWRKYDLFMPYLFQPVHNIYLLIAGEIGILGLLLFLVLVFLILKSAHKNKLFLSAPQCRLRRLLLGCSCVLVLLCFLVFGFFDHFFWTLQQGRLMLWVLLGILAGIYSIK